MELGLNNILTEDQIEDLFSGDAEDIDVNGEGDETAKENEEKENNVVTNKITEVDGDELFGQSESVGNEEDNDEKTEDSPDKGDGSSSNFYSSIAKALVEEGVLQNLNDDELGDINDANALKVAINKQIQDGLSEAQRRINEALEYGVEPSDIKKYENTLAYLDNIKDSDLTSETNNGINLRKQLIYQDLINKGYSQERAERELKKSFSQGTDIDDAKDALNANKEYFTTGYQSMLDEAKRAEEEEIEMQRRHAEEFEKNIMSSKTVLGGINVNEATRRKIYDNVTNPVYTDKDGNKMTALQKYQYDNKEEFLKTVSAIFTLTDGFRDFSMLAKQEVTRERKKGLANLESVINNTQRDNNGNIRFASGVGDANSYFKDFDIDI